MTPKKVIFWLAGVFCALTYMTAAGQTSNKGTDFWLGYGKHIAHGSRNPETMALYITSDVSTNAVVEIASINFSKTVQITANQVTEVTIPSSAHLNDEGYSDHGIHVTSEKPVIVYAHIYQSAISGATLVLPVNALGMDYYSINYKQISNDADSYSYFFVVATEDNTTVEITPSQNTQSGRPKNVPFTVNLMKGQVYQVLAEAQNRTIPAPEDRTDIFSYGDDLTGSKIRSIASGSTGCKKIAVFSGSTKIAINCPSFRGETAMSDPGSSDNLFQQVYPTAAWGKSFVTVRLKNRPFDVYRIIKSDPAAVVKLNGQVIPSSSFINNLYYEFTSSSGITNVITSDKPIQAVQYSVTQNRNLNCINSNNDLGDPEMIFLNPLEQTLNKITMYSTPNAEITSHYINVVIKADGVNSFKLDGVNRSSSFQPVPSMPGYFYAQLTVNVGTHTLTSEGGFNAIAYGFGNHDSYGYAAGANLSAYGIVPMDLSTSAVVETGCVESTYAFDLKLPYQPESLFYDLDDGKGLVEITPNLKSQTTDADGAATFIYEFINSFNASAPRTYGFRAIAVKPTLDECGSGDELVFDFVVNAKPAADFDQPGNGCINQPVNFTFKPVSSNTPITDFAWDFNGEGLSEEENPSFTFTTPGEKLIKLRVKSTEGCWSDVFEKKLEIKNPPAADFTVSAVQCENEPITFTSNSIVSEGTIVNYIWDFGDGSPLVEGNDKSQVSHQFSYNDSTPYQVKLTIESSFGCTDVKILPILINVKPAADFIMPDFCLADGTARFTNTSTIPDGTEDQMTYLWDFGDGSTSTDKDASHVYSRSDNYLVTLTVRSDSGCESTKTETFTVNGSNPNPSFNVLNENSLCSSQPVLFEDNSTVDFGEITKIEWTFDDTDPASVISYDPRQQSSSQYSYSYPAFHSPASKTIMVRMRAYSGSTLACANETSRYIVLNAVPEVKFDPVNPVCAETLPFQVTQASELHSFTGRGTYTGPGISADGLFSPALAGPGNHTITYTFTADNGCSDQKSQVITVWPTPLVNAGENKTILAGGRIQLEASVTGSNLTYKWSPSAGLDRDDIPNPTASPEEDTEYILTVTSGDGCSASDKILVSVLEMPKIPNAFTPNGDGSNDLWNIQYLESYPGAVITVVNRYGKQVFYSLGYTSPWDGRQDGNDLPSGTYYYVINPKNGRKPITGYVSIIR